MKYSEDNFSKTLSYLTSLEKFGIKLGLEKMCLFLESIASPHRRYRTVLIAGTNGKGSTASMIAELSRAAGLKTGLYTSPHLVTVLERIKINSISIGEEDFIKSVENLRELVENFSPGFRLTLFEFLTALAFLHFDKERVDLAVLEVGLGGRLDATSVVHPELSVITEIDFDHTEYLGNSLGEIAIEKCGVIKKNGIALLTSQKVEVIDAVEKNCNDKGATLYRYGKDYSSDLSASSKGAHRIDFKNAYTEMFAIDLNLPGAHQRQNAATAIQAIQLLTREKFQKNKVQTGFNNLQLDGRAEVINAASKRFVLDIAHNANASECLLKTITEEFEYHSLLLIVGIMADKDTLSMLKILVPLSKITVVTVPRTERAAAASSLKACADHFSESVISTDSVESAITTAIGIATVDDLILITGSCYTVGEAKEYLSSLQVR